MKVLAINGSALKNSNAGYEMPIIGLGTWTLNDDEAEASVWTKIAFQMLAK